MGAVLGSALYIGLWRLEVTTLITWDQCSMTPVGRLITGEVGYKPDPVVPVDQQGVCAALVTGASHVGEAVQISICFFSRDILELSFPRRRTLAQREPVSSFVSGKVHGSRLMEFAPPPRSTTCRRPGWGTPHGLFTE